MFHRGAFSQENKVILILNANVVDCIGFINRWFLTVLFKFVG